MSVSMRNQEGYADPTASEALSRIEKAGKITGFRPVVYICSPYAGDVKTNTEEAKKYSRFAVDKGYIPITPHLLFPQFMDESERELAIFMDLVLLKKCAELWIFGSNITDGMHIEIQKAKNRNMVIRYFTTNLEEASQCTKS